LQHLGALSAKSRANQRGDGVAFTDGMLIDPAGVNPLTHTIIGGAMNVHRVFGPGLLENVYPECLAFELRALGLGVELGTIVPLTYRGRRLSSHFVLDMCVEGKVIVEAKSVTRLALVHTSQLLTYLKLTGLPIGLLINFNVPVLKEGIKRVINPNYVGSAVDSPVSQTEMLPNPRSPNDSQ
jgi:GxxExxY protein